MSSIPDLAEKELKEFWSKDAAKYAETIVNRVVSDRSPCVLSLPTGAGKSTVIPYAFLQKGFRVMMSLPTVAMCANVVNSFQAMFPSVKVGQAFGREIDIPKDARLVITSNGALKKRMLGAVKSGGVCVSIEFTDILFIDEVHMNLLDTFSIVSLWYYCSTKFATTARMPRLLLSSATVSDTLFSRRFAPCVELPPDLMTKTPFPVTKHFAEQDYTPSDPKRYKEMGALLRSLHESRPIDERILLFLPGEGEMTKTLSACGLKHGVDITLVTISSKSVIEDYKPIERKVDPLRLVVFATPSADAGLTIVGLKHVIDSLLVKNSHVQPNGSEDLIIEVASKQLSKQRQGRVGRKTPGDYYPMCTEAFYNDPSSMPPSYTLEILRRPLYNEILEFVSHGIQVEEVFGIYNIPSLAGYIDQLLNWGLLGRSPTSGDLFPSRGGTFMTQTELASPRLAGVLYAWVRMGYPVVEGVILSQLISGVTSQILQIPNFESRPGEPKGKMMRMQTDFKRKKYGRFFGPSDIHTAIRMWNALIAETSSSTSTGRPGDIVTCERWCIANAIQWRSLKNVMKSIQKTIPRIAREAQKLNPDLPANEHSYGSLSWIIDESRVVPVLRRLMEHVYQDQIGTRNGADTRVIYVVNRDGSTIEPSQKGFTIQSDPESATPYPTRIIIIGQRTAAGKLELTQFLDVDNHDLIANISTEELNNKLAIFMTSVGKGTSIRKTR